MLEPMTFRKILKVKPSRNHTSKGQEARGRRVGIATRKVCTSSHRRQRRTALQLRAQNVLQDWRCVPCLYIPEGYAKPSQLRPFKNRAFANPPLAREIRRFLPCRCHHNKMPCSERHNPRMYSECYNGENGFSVCCLVDFLSLL